MKLKKEYFILAALIIALILYLVLRKTDRTHYTLPDLPDVVEKRISKIEIGISGKRFLLTKKDDAWGIGPEAYPADSDKVKKMTDVIGKLKITALVSESKNYFRYGLKDDNKISVKALMTDGASREFEIGKNAPTFRHTFVKLTGDANVYHADGDFRSRFDHTVDDLRDKTALSFEQDAITEIVASKDKQTLTAVYKTAPPPGGGTTTTAADATQNQKKEMIWQNEEGNRLDKAKVQRLLSPLSRLKCRHYIENKKKTAFKDPIISVRLKGDKDYSLQIFSKAKKDDEVHPAISSDNDYPFALPVSEVKTITSALQELMNPEGKKKDSAQGPTSPTGAEKTN